MTQCYECALMPQKTGPPSQPLLNTLNDRARPGTQRLRQHPKGRDGG